MKSNRTKGGEKAVGFPVSNIKLPVLCQKNPISNENEITKKWLKIDVCIEWLDLAQKKKQKDYFFSKKGFSFREFCGILLTVEEKIQIFMEVILCI